MYTKKYTLEIYLAGIKGLNFYVLGGGELGYKGLDTEKAYLVTGVAGFIGYFLSERLLGKGLKVIGIDNINDYYDTYLKYARLKDLNAFNNFVFVKGDISVKDMAMKVF